MTGLEIVRMGVFVVNVVEVIKNNIPAANGLRLGCVTNVLVRVLSEDRDAVPCGIIPYVTSKAESSKKTTRVEEYQALDSVAEEVARGH